MKVPNVCALHRLLMSWVFTALCLTSATGQQEAAVVGNVYDGFTIESAQFVDDPTESISPNQFSSGQIAGSLIDISAFDSPLESEADVFWLKLNLRNQNGSAGIWILDFENWVEVDAYYEFEGESRHLKAGHLVPYNDRDYTAANKNLIPVEITGRGTTEAIVRLKRSINYLQVPNNLTFRIYPEEVFEQKETWRRFAMGLFTGFYVIMLLYNLFIYFSTRDVNYLPYLIALLAAVCLTFHNAGYTVAIFSDFEGYVHWHSKMQFFLSQILGSSMLVFAALFLDVKKRYPGFYKGMWVLLGLILVLPVPSLLGYASINEKLSGLLGISSMIYILTLAIKSYRDKHPSSGLFLVGYGAFALGIVVILSTFIGVLPVEFQEYYPMNIGSTIEMVFFSLALGNRINVLAKDNEEKQAQIISQLREKEELQANINRELEIKVTERTKEIERQKVLIEEEKEKADKLLLNILPASVANELKEYGAARPKSYDSVSVLFIDLVGFTKRAEGMTPRELIAELDYCFQAFDHIVANNGLEKIKTVGDEYMAAGGVPEESSDSTIRTVKAALEIQRFMQDWSEELESSGERPWRARVGIHTGEVIAGVVGKDKFAYDIWGDTVNTASRIETASEPDMVNVSGVTYDLVKDSIVSEYRGKIQIKEKEVDMYYITALK